MAKVALLWNRFLNLKKSLCDIVRRSPHYDASKEKYQSSSLLVGLIRLPDINNCFHCSNYQPFRTESALIASSCCLIVRNSFSLYVLPCDHLSFFSRDCFLNLYFVIIHASSYCVDNMFLCHWQSLSSYLVFIYAKAISDKVRQKIIYFTARNKKQQAEWLSHIFNIIALTTKYQRRSQSYV